MRPRRGATPLRRRAATPGARSRGSAPIRASSGSTRPRPTCSTGRSRRFVRRMRRCDMAWRRMPDMTRFTKGHGTENDFVLVPDLEGSLELTPAQVQRIADRHAGLGADGVIRVVRTIHSTDEGVRALADQAEWFMDYRNADGSLAEMCGNGTRVFAEYLRREQLAFGASFAIATRAGLKTVRVVEGGYAVDLGPWRLADEEGARRDGFDGMVRPRHGKPVPALSVDVGNPHAVVMLPEGITLEALDLGEAPELHPE